jgi:hypothetical protein
MHTLHLSESNTQVLYLTLRTEETRERKYSLRMEMGKFLGRVESSTACKASARLKEKMGEESRVRRSSNEPSA